MKKHAWASLVLLAGCMGESVTPPAEFEPEAGDEGTELILDPAKLSNPTAELGTDKTRPIAKTIEWLPIGTEQGVTFNGEAVVVDRITRDDANGLYGVQIRLKNRTKDRQKLQWLVRFYTRTGGQIMGYAGGLGAGERWQGAVVEPYGSVTVSDFARSNGAEGFRLFVKGAGGAGDGTADVVKPKDE